MSKLYRIPRRAPPRYYWRSLLVNSNLQKLSEYPLLIMLGTFCGLMYNFIVPAGQWFYPWDMPTLLFFTWACLLFDSGRLFTLILIVWLGALFKETVLCCSLLVLFCEPWSFKKRLAGWVALLVAYYLAKRFLMTVYGVNTMFFALQNSGNVPDLLHKTGHNLAGNLKQLFGFSLNHVLFVNAGSLFIMLLIPWRNRREVVLKSLALAFIIGQFFYGGITEFRDWYELLPLSWILISEALARRFPSFPLGPPTPSGTTYSASHAGAGLWNQSADDGFLLAGAGRLTVAGVQCAPLLAGRWHGWLIKTDH